MLSLNREQLLLLNIIYSNKPWVSHIIYKYYNVNFHLLPEETEEDTKWLAKKFNKLGLLQYENGVTLLAVLEETRQGKKAVPVSQRAAVMSAAHNKANWGITKAAEKNCR